MRDKSTQTANLIPHTARRIAFYSPLNPIQSGISDYSEELLPYLADAGLQVTLFVDNYQPTNRNLATRFEICAARDFARIHRRQPFTAAVYQMGNSPAHAYISKAIFENKGKLLGVVVLHEFVLHHLVMWMALNGGQKRDYQAEMARRYGVAGTEAARRVLQGQTPDSLFNYPLSERIINAADRLIVHSQYMAERIHALDPAKPVTIVPMGVPLPPQIEREAARARLGITPHEFVIASLGHINPYKRLTPSLRAYKAFAMVHPHSRYFMVGSISANYNVARQIEALGLSDRVIVTGHVDTATFNDYLAAADVCLNLRYPSAGETSAALLRIMGAGQAVIVSNTAAFAELPSATAARVDVDADEESLLLEYLLAFAERPALRYELGRHARKYIARFHTLEGAAAGYDAVLHDQPWDAQAYARTLLITAASDTPAPLIADYPHKTAHGIPTTHNSQFTTHHSPPPLSPPPPILITALADAAAEVGVGPDDDFVLRQFAKVAVDLQVEDLTLRALRLLFHNP